MWHLTNTTLSVSLDRKCYSWEKYRDKEIAETKYQHQFARPEQTFKGSICSYFINICLNVCLSVHHMHAWWPKRSEEGLSSLELQLQAVVSCHVIAGKWAQVRFQSHGCSWLINHLSSPRSHSLIWLNKQTWPFGRLLAHVVFLLWDLFTLFVFFFCPTF